MLCRLAAMVVLVLWSAGCGGTNRKEWVDAYCYYGARSESQIDGCLSHVTVRQVERSSSAAAFCARDGGDACSGAGRYWQDFLSLRDRSSAGE